MRRNMPANKKIRKIFYFNYNSWKSIIKYTWKIGGGDGEHKQHCGLLFKIVPILNF